MITLTVNGKQHQIDLEPDTPLLWAIRDAIGSPAPNSAAASRNAAPAPCISTAQAMRSCSVPIGRLEGASITTIEGLSPDGKHPVQQAWLAEDVPQCGYCQSGRSWRRRRS